MFKQLNKLGLLDRFESLLSGVVYSQIEVKVKKTCPKEWAEPLLSGLREWLKETLVPWLAVPYSRGSKSGMLKAIRVPSIYNKIEAEESRAMISGIVSKFDFYLCRILCDLR